MGACGSCLNSVFGGASKDDPANTPLLPPSSHPQSASYGYYHPPSPSPSNALHEREYLERLVAQTSENLIDIFSPPMLTSSMSVTPSSRGEWYKALLERAEVPTKNENEVVILDPKEVGDEERKWLEELVRRGEEAVSECARVKEVGRLVVGLEMEG